MIPSSLSGTPLTLKAGLEHKALRLDQFLMQAVPGHSRTYFQRLIDNKCITINNKCVTKHSTLIKGEETIEILFPEPIPLESKITAHNLTIPIVYEHPDFLIINKPAGLMVHKPAHHIDQPTLVDWLIYTFKDLSEIGSPERPGIVHRLDKDTSGLMIIARNNQAQRAFNQMFADRSIHKTYYALVHGTPVAQGSIQDPIARDPIARHKMTHRLNTGRKALTHYTVAQYFEHATLVHAFPVTGRTHQIRVHFAGLGHPLVGDSIYTTNPVLLQSSLHKNMPRHALHAAALRFTYQGIDYSFSQEAPLDFLQTLALCQP